MANLSELLPSLIKKIKKYHSLYEKNEMAVREQIVSPILKNLGWDTENPEEVRPNITIEEGIPDYTLIKNEKKILFIEVKNLSIDIEQKGVIRQLANYSFSEGTRYGIATNGVLWFLVRSFQEGTTLADRIIWKVNLIDEESTAILRKISTISKTNIDHIEDLVKKSQILGEIWQSLLNEPAGMIKAIIPEVQLFILQSYSNYQFEEIEIEEFLKEKIEMILSGKSEENYMNDTPMPVIAIWQDKKLQRMILKDEIIEIRNNYEILVNTANWLINNDRLKSSDCPLAIGGGKRFLINTVPEHKNGISFSNPKELSNGLWIETHQAKKQLVDYAYRLLQAFGFSSDILKIE